MVTFLYRRSMTLFRPSSRNPVQVMEGETGRRAVEEMRSKVTPALLATWTIWPLANLVRPLQSRGERVSRLRKRAVARNLALLNCWFPQVNFRFVPLEHRILFCNVISVGPDMGACRQLVCPMTEKQLGVVMSDEECVENVMGPSHKMHITHEPHTPHSAGGLHILSVPHPSQEAIRIQGKDQRWGAWPCARLTSVE